jgi:hypothetical protein
MTMTSGQRKKHSVFCVFFFSARRKIHRIGSQQVLQIFRRSAANAQF